VSSLSDAERDAGDVVRALAGLAALLARSTGDQRLDDAQGTPLNVAENGGAAAVRVLAYLRALRGAGDGEAVAMPPRLGPWRDWVPQRGNLLGFTGGQRLGEVHPRRADPGE